MFQKVFHIVNVPQIQLPLKTLATALAMEPSGQAIVFSPNIHTEEKSMPSPNAFAQARRLEGLGETLVGKVSVNNTYSI